MSEFVLARVAPRRFYLKDKGLNKLPFTQRTIKSALYHAKIGVTVEKI